MVEGAMHHGARLDGDYASRGALDDREQRRAWRCC
ncbi:hypothetical protein EV646_11353 [Kribbella antiqua]|uniref:Uncharacterized protein n=1 Tax=Kribbella antiqua TaxID=2512217 RepID=A0A4R2ICX7_9ACTN|nr:hypothetical protein EV646_11353 [Kribbella antiqua]